MRNLDLWTQAREEATVLECGLKALKTEHDSKTGMKYCLKMWKPKAKKPFANYYFKNEIHRETYIQDQIKRHSDRQQSKARYKKERQGTQEQIDAVKVGDIFHYSWGYDQTNADFFQVVEKKGRHLWIREIGKTMTQDGTGNSMSGSCMPDKDSFRNADKPQKKLLQFTGGKPYIKINSFGWCSPWDGKKCYISWYC